MARRGEIKDDDLLYHVTVSNLRRAIADAGFRCEKPQGAYYIFADYSKLSDDPAPDFARRLAKEAGVAPVPGSSFYADADPYRTLVRFAFCKRTETLEEAGERLRNFSKRHT